MEVIREHRSDAIFIQSDSCSSFIATDAAARDRAEFLSEQGFVGWDLTYGRAPSPRVIDWLTSNGMGPERLEWFAEHGSPAGCIVGHDYYRGTEWLVLPGEKLRPAGTRRRGYLAVGREHSARYGLPFMLSETNMPGRLAPGWLSETWNDVLALRGEGAPIRGYCWYGFVDHVDWDSALTRDRGRVNQCGLVSLDRVPHRVGTIYSELARAALAGRVEPLIYPE
jgi:hypothetical protein